MTTANPALRLKRLQDLDVESKRVLARVDYNVPMKDGKVTDDTRIRETLKTLEYLLSQDAKVVLIAHLGRPKGKPEPKYSLAPVAPVLAGLLKRPVAVIIVLYGNTTRPLTVIVEDKVLLILELAVNVLVNVSFNRPLAVRVFVFWNTTRPSTAKVVDLVRLIRAIAVRVEV